MIQHDNSPDEGPLHSEPQALLLCNVAGCFAGVPSAVVTGDILALIAEPDNSYDANAIMVCIPGGGKLGYIPRDLTAKIHSAVAEGKSPYAVVQGVTYKKIKFIVGPIRASNISIIVYV